MAPVTIRNGPPRHINKQPGKFAMEEITVMQGHFVKLVCLIGFLLFAGITHAQNNSIYYTLESNATPVKINRVNLTSPNAPQIFRSANFTAAGGPAQTFSLVFPASFAGQYETTPDLTPAAPRPNGEIAFDSSPTGPGGSPCQIVLGALGTRDCQEIRIRLTPAGATNAEGWNYKVEMGGEVLDPRLRGN